jgi:hypothetical protein
MDASVNGAGTVSTASIRCGGLIGCATRHLFLANTSFAYREAGIPEVELQIGMFFGAN